MTQQLFKQVFRKDVYESNTEPLYYLIVEGIGDSQRVKVEYRDGRPVSESEAKSAIDDWSSQHRVDKNLIALKALVKGLPEEYDDIHTKNLIDKAQAVIDNNT
jgi:hypothetical protein